MKYSFPEITTIDDVLAAIEGREEFVVKHCPEADVKIINYNVNFEDTFPPVTDRRSALLRECRGITFCAKTGEIRSRKFHKFFNLGERPETQSDQVDFTQPHVYLEKLDGSMITPLLVKGEVRWCTKMGLTQVAAPVDEFTKNKLEYHEFAKYWMAEGWTPIFEWCSRQQRIVIDYPTDRLVLTAMRANVSGEYMERERLVSEADAYGIPVVKAGPVRYELDHDALEEIRNVENEEGMVFSFEGGDLHGHKVKVKGSWYCQLHKTLEHLNLEKDVIRLIIDEKLDDAKPFLPEDLVQTSDDFAKEIFAGLRKTASDLYWEVQADYDNFNGGKKRFAARVMAERKDMSKHLFSTWDRLDQGEEGVYEYLLDLVSNSLSTQSRVDSVRHLWGGKSWYSYRNQQTED